MACEALDVFGSDRGLYILAFDPDQQTCCHSVEPVSTDILNTGTLLHLIMTITLTCFFNEQSVPCGRDRYDFQQVHAALIIQKDKDAGHGPRSD